ncbi:MAG: response regulator transcription factor [Calditrichaeota bacterium]|nr:response regulator transcription factor [Calditrichota bacterium]
MAEKQVAIIEDEEDFRNGLMRVVNAIPHFQCQNGYESFEEFFVALDQSKIPDLIITDINLPGMSGIEGIEILHRKYPELIIIVLTVFNEDQKIFNALKSGAISYILKADAASNIQHILSVVFNGGAYMSPSIAFKVSEYFQNQVMIADLEELSERENEVIDLLISGKKYQEIGDELFLSIDTVRYHVKNVYKKLQVNSKFDVMKILRNK